MARDVSTFARHDKKGGSSEQSQRQNLRRKTKIASDSSTDALVSWQGRLFEAKESGCEILDAPGQSFGLRPVCSLIRSRNVVFNSNSYLSGGFQKDPTSSHLQGGVFP